MSSAHSPNLSITSPTSQLILQPFRRFTYVTAHSPTLPLLHLHHSSFSNPSFASPTSQALHLRHLANRSCISMLGTKFLQNIVADTNKNKALIDCHKCCSSFLSIAKSHPLKIPAIVLEKVRAGSCLKLFLIDCRWSDEPFRRFTYSTTLPLPHLCHRHFTYVTRRAAHVHKHKTLHLCY